MGDALAAQKVGEHLAGFHRDGAHQHGLALGVMLLDGGQHRVELGGLVLVDHVVQILADVGLVGGNLHHVQGVDALELLLLGLGGAGHARQLLIHAEVVLEGDGGQGLALPLHLHMLLGLDGLVQALGVAAADHQAAGELVHDDHLAVLHHVVDVPAHERVGAQGAVDVVVQLGVLGIVQVLNAEGGFYLLGALVGQGAGLLLLIHLVVDVPLHGAHHRVGLLVEDGALVALAGDDQGRAGLVDEDGVHLVHNGEVMTPLHQVLLADDHVVPQVVEAQLVVGTVGDVAGVGLAALVRLHVMDDQTHRQPQEAVNLAHPLAVAAGQVIVDGHHVHALAGQRVQVRRQRGYQGLALAGLHFSDAALMHHQTADELHPVVPHAHGAAGRLAHRREGLGEDVVLRLALLQPLAELVRLAAQLLIAELHVVVFQRFNGVDRLVQLLQLRIVAAAQQLLDPFHHIGHFSLPVFRVRFIVMPLPAFYLF